MHKHPEITVKRLKKALSRIEATLYSMPLPLTVEAWHVHGEPVPVEEAMRQTYLPFVVGEMWGPAWDTTWLRCSGAIPREWKGREVEAHVHLGFMSGEGFTVEGLVWQDGVPTRAINVNRPDVPLAAKAKGNESFTFYVEAAANPRAAQHATNALMLADPEGNPLFTLTEAKIVCVNREAWDLYFDYKTAYETLLAVPEKTARRGQLMYALNSAVNIFEESEPATFSPARKALQDVLNRRNGDTVHTLSAIGHAHIDTAWLWPLRETIRKCARTFSTALAYMETYPDYVFGCSQPQQYAWMKHYYPSIWAGIKKAVRKGQWEPIGSMWIEADCNVSSGESLVRQMLHGKNFFLEEFGVETKDVWIPDVFGYSASMPQLMKKAGVEWFLTQKISWNQFNKFPHHTFEWEGIDGTRIFTHFPPADTYNARMVPEELAANVTNFKDHDRATRSLYVYGFGDGGGGPTKAMLEVAKRVKNLEGLPKVELEKVSDFFQKAQKDARDLPRWVGELYLEFHRGTYTTQAATKKGNRTSEFLLRDAEFFDVIAGTTCEPVGPEPEHAVYDVSNRTGKRTNAAWLNRAWKLLLLNQFHDIIPGSSIHWVYLDAAQDYAAIKRLGEGVVGGARGALLAQIDTSGLEQPVVVFNTASHAREAVVTLPGGGPLFVSVPACGYAVVEGAQERPVGSFAKPVEVVRSKAGITLDNGIHQVEFDTAGFVSRVFDHRAGREALAPGAKGNVFQLFRDHPTTYDAWDVEIFDRDCMEEIGGLESIELVEETQLRATVKIVRAFNRSRITQRVTLRAGSPRIDFHTEIDWREDHKLLKVAFPVNVRSPRATYEIQYGHTERPTHYNTSWDLARFEVCAQKWADLTEGDYGVALLSDCKYGYDILDNVMRLSLLRAPTAPDPVADRGLHSFCYSLLPHAGDFREGGVIEQGYALNNPLQVVAATAHPGALPKSRGFFEIDRPGVIIEAVKRAEKGDALIVRFYEAYGTRGRMTFKTKLPYSRVATADLLERTQSKLLIDNGEVTLDIAPFEVVTLKFER